MECKDCPSSLLGYCWNWYKCAHSTERCLACRLHKQQNDGQIFLSLLVFMIPAISVECFLNSVELLALVSSEWCGLSSFICRFILYLSKVVPVDQGYRELQGGEKQVLKQDTGSHLPKDCSFWSLVRQLQLRVVQSCDFSSKSKGKEVIPEEKHKTIVNCLMSGRILGRSMFSVGNVSCGWRPGWVPFISTLKMFCIWFIIAVTT